MELYYNNDLLAVPGCAPTVTTIVMLVAFPVNVAIPQKRALPMSSLTIVESDVLLHPPCLTNSK